MLSDAYILSPFTKYIRNQSLEKNEVCYVLLQRRADKYIKPDKPDPAAAKVLQEILGGHYGEMRTMMQFFFQSSNFRGKQKQYRDLLRGHFFRGDRPR